MLMRVVFNLVSFAVVCTAHASSQGPRVSPSEDIQVVHDTGVVGRRVISIGDLHGDLESTKLIMEKMGIASFKGNDPTWTGGNTVLVSTGDTVDRGEWSYEIYLIFAKLASLAEKAGGEVVNLVGNHELMNFQHDFRYVPQSEWSSRHYEGRRMEMWHPDGEIGSDIVGRYKAVAVVDRTLFVHGGLSPDFLDFVKKHTGTKDVVAEINRKFKELMKVVPLPYQSTTDPFVQKLVGQKGPFWNRFFAEGRNEQKVCKALERTLEAVGADRMVLGHTQQVEGVTSRCGGRILLADTVISEAYKPSFGFHRPSAVEYVGGKVKVTYFPGGSPQNAEPVAKDWGRSEL